jgi:hypothetical protein
MVTNTKTKTQKQVEVEVAVKSPSKESFLTACIMWGTIDLPNYGKLTEASYKKAILVAKDLDAAYEKYKG